MTYNRLTSIILMYIKNHSKKKIKLTNKIYKNNMISNNILNKKIIILIVMIKQIKFRKKIIKIKNNIRIFLNNKIKKTVEILNNQEILK
jgi:hypothetical protein